MIQGVLTVAIALLCLAGLSDLIWKTALWLSRRKEGRRATLVLLLPSSGEEIEPTLRHALLEAQTMGNRRCSGLLAVDDGLPPEARSAAELFCRNREGVTLCVAHDLPRRLREQQENS